MSFIFRKPCTAAAVALLATLLAPTVHAEIVTNGGFNAGTLDGWTSSGIAGTSCATAVNSACSATLYSTGTLSSLSQTLATVAGATYNFSFWLDNGAPSEISFTVDGDELYGLHNAPDSLGYLHVTGRFVAADASTTIAFNLTAPNERLYIDEVSVIAAVPEPASLLLVGGALAGLGVSRRRAVQVAG